MTVTVKVTVTVTVTITVRVTVTVTVTVIGRSHLVSLISLCVSQNRPRCCYWSEETFFSFMGYHHRYTKGQREELRSDPLVQGLDNRSHGQNLSSTSGQAEFTMLIFLWKSTRGVSVAVCMYRVLQNCNPNLLFRAVGFSLYEKSSANKETRPWDQSINKRKKNERLSVVMVFCWFIYIYIVQECLRPK